MKSKTWIRWIAPILLSSCDAAPEADLSGTRYSACYIQDYIEVANLTAQGNSSHLDIVAQGKTIAGNTLSASYNDLAYNREIVPHSTQAVCNCFKSIDLISDRDFDERHKAGASLADIVFLAGASPYDYIRSGYTQQFDWSDAPSFYKENRLDRWYNANNKPVYIRLSEIGERDLLLLNPMFFLVFESQPTASKSHEFTLTIVDEKGRTIRTGCKWNASE